MSVQEFGSMIDAVTAFASAAISTNTTTNGSIIDTARRPHGICFIANISAYTDGTYEYRVFESDASNMAGATEISAEQKVGQGANPTQAAATSTAVWDKITAINTKRYVQLRIVSTSVTTGATHQAVALFGPDLIPAA